MKFQNFYSEINLNFVGPVKSLEKLKISQSLFMWLPLRQLEILKAIKSQTTTPEKLDSGN